eukprot:CAMPEP_0206619452 /NCGR_PEP_ID=MMETSP0325_2-20121206/60837_1 /ASSEMBLY_ACC=CAM_ASM_000347 /TAXON_ID=2866 /ORGANISM="Crypthecodinium cohnii, Strain Seligo" /LENGTH=199 /DNA_ID=CAMNT_0054141825 /DNA_START=1 /DNA_END=601 /DNA_ORIENTATION=-
MKLMRERPINWVGDRASNERDQGNNKGAIIIIEKTKKTKKKKKKKKTKKKKKKQRDRAVDAAASARACRTVGREECLCHFFVHAFEQAQCPVRIRRRRMEHNMMWPHTAAASGGTPSSNLQSEGGKEPGGGGRGRRRKEKGRRGRPLNDRRTEPQNAFARPEQGPLGLATANLTTQLTAAQNRADSTRIEARANEKQEL